MLKRIVVGVSGGVDSTVAAMLLKRKGFEVLGVYMRNWDDFDEFGHCSGLQDIEDAKYVCSKLSIPFRTADFVKQYWNEVFSYLMSEYQAGLTPNPDIICNKKIKFDVFLKYATAELGADAIATGHYANTSFGPYLEHYHASSNVRLLAARDTFKDQTFFLSQIAREALKKTMFPLGNFTKNEVRKIALENGFEKIVKKKESMGVCFIGQRNFQNFISDYLVSKPGPFVNLLTGEVVGSHQGVHLWTIGQGSRIGGIKEPFFIAAKNADTNTVYVVPGTHHPALFVDLMYLASPHWIADNMDTFDVLHCHFRFQHTKPLVPCTVIRLNDADYLLFLQSPLRAITPGQYAVLYKDNECLGSAKIVRAGPSYFTLGKKISKDYNEYPYIDNLKLTYNRIKA